MSMEDYSLYDREDPTLSSFEQTIYDEISMEEPWALVERFSELDRLSGSAGEREAAEYIEDRLEALGIGYDRYNPTIGVSVPKAASCHIPTESMTLEEDSTAFSTVKPELYSATGSVRAEVVRVGGDGDDALDGVDLSDINIRGKIALVEGFVSIDAKLTLEDAGAVGIVGISPVEHEPQWGRVSTHAWGNVPEPGTGVGDGAVAVTVARSVGGELLARLEDDGSLELELSATVEDGWYECPIIVAEVEAGAPMNEDDFVLFHAHYDSWDFGVTDNATGDAGLLECARVLHEHREELRRDLRVAWWPGHTQGSYSGSAWYVDEFAFEIDEHCVAHVNMDSPGAKDATEFTDMVAWMPEADALCRSAIDDVAGKETNEYRPMRAGDYSFNNLGVTGLLLVSSNIPQEVRQERGYAPAGSGGNSDAYHVSTDTLEKADPDVLVRDIRVYAVVLSRLLTDDIPPLDFRHTLERHKEIVSEYAEHAGDRFDLTPVTDTLDELTGVIEQFYREIEQGTIDPAEATEVLKRLSRHLVRVNFATRGRFDQDPTTTIPPYPSLEPATELPAPSTEKYFARRLYLRRARNQVVDHLRRARDEVDCAVRTSALE